MTETFTPPMAPSADGGTGEEATPTVEEVRFDDGYLQTTPLGLNAFDGETLSLAWSVLSKEDADAIEGFLKPKLRHEGFFWTKPSEDAPKKWRCMTWRRRPLGGDLYAIAVTFERDLRL